MNKNLRKEKTPKLREKISLDLHWIKYKGGAAMKILKRGEIRLKTKTFECKGCGTVFEATEKEYRAADQLAYLHDGITAYCDCPICKKSCYSED